MRQLIVRNVPEKLVRALKVRAATAGRSAEAEHRLILEQVLRLNRPEFWARADLLRKRTASRQRHDSARLLRRLRDER